MFYALTNAEVKNKLAPIWSSEACGRSLGEEPSFIYIRKKRSNSKRLEENQMTCILL